MYLQMDPLDNPLSTRPIQTGREYSIEPYPNARFGFIDNPDRQFGAGSVLTRTRTRSDGPEPLLTLGFRLVYAGVQILVGEIRIFGVEQVAQFEIGSMCHLVDDSLERLCKSGHCDSQDWFMG